MIRINQLSKSFDKERAIDEVSLHIQKGSIYGLLGSNGAGKTTLLKVLAGIYRGDKGSVQIHKQDVFENIELKGKIMFMPDAPYFFPQSSILQMASYYKRIYPQWSQQRFDELGQIFKLDQKRKLHRMSKGMQRQAAFWLALSCMPELLIMDEPIDGLDPVMRQQIKNLLFQEVSDRQLTVLISSHNLREIEDLCDHVGIMHKGQMIVEKELDDLKADTHKIQVAFRHPEEAEAIQSELNLLHIEQRGSIMLFIVKGEREQIKSQFQAFKPYVLDILPLTLEEIFIYEMGDAGYDVTPLIL
jgi:ABC-2 type transport system ATP-binding protein